MLKTRVAMRREEAREGTRDREAGVATSYWRLKARVSKLVTTQYISFSDPYLVLLRILLRMTMLHVRCFFLVEPPVESCEFQVISVDNKIWTFEAPSPEVSNRNEYTIRASQHTLSHSYTNVTGGCFMGESH